MDFTSCPCYRNSLLSVLWNGWLGLVSICFNLYIVNSKKRKLKKIRDKNIKVLSDSQRKFDEFKRLIGVKRDDFVTCTMSFKIDSWYGGFTKGCKYRVLGICPDFTISILDDENKEYDPMDLTLNEFNEYFK